MAENNRTIAMQKLAKLAENNKPTAIQKRAIMYKIDDEIYLKFVVLRLVGVLLSGKYNEYNTALAQKKDHNICFCTTITSDAQGTWFLRLH